MCLSWNSLRFFVPSLKGLKKGPTPTTMMLVTSVSCKTSSSHSEDILKTCLNIKYKMYRLDLNVWMVRTDSNIADDPSRGHVDLLESVRCNRQQLDLQLMWNALLELLRREALTSNAFPS